ncbi:hypothetical protein [Sulfurimonas sp. RIFOXYB12_FULL_35_9]|uniref:hypothetical protein n=1 Tax=Sulfurimonas sp. RIFOXYB12_FULL_35_9 TaxID=1802256 RepID=UPI0008D37887|nr:hypothetical protein [Sulfurimonas sp. RIFOXYB12_FULL_35_9]OHE04606.1 MAG: hypothetical protein A2345_10120 [Sulfurimonas sp. RIFOXYB12_FULL_35_9]
MFSRVRNYILSLIIHSMVVVLFILYIDSLSKDYLIPLVAAISALIALHGIINQYDINKINNAKKIDNNKKIIRTYFNVIVDTLNYEIKTLNEMLEYSQNIFDNQTTFITGKTIIYNKMNEYTNKLLDKELHVGLDSDLLIMSIKLKDLYFYLLDTKTILENQDLTQEKEQKLFFKLIKDDIVRLENCIKEINDIYAKI